VLAGNTAVARFRATVGAREPSAGPAQADFAFADLGTGERWTIRINDGALPWWVLAKNRRVPGTGPSDYLALARLLSGKAEQTVGDRVPVSGASWERSLEPVSSAVLNTDPAIGSARSTAGVVRESSARGGRASSPRIAEPTSAAAFIDPATAWLAE
ncbi:hypothetical protein OY671_011977, partial [Metschnikowia pulcherrima]